MINSICEIREAALRLYPLSRSANHHNMKDSAVQLYNGPLNVEKSILGMWLCVFVRCMNVFLCLVFWWICMLVDICAFVCLCKSVMNGSNLRGKSSVAWGLICMCVWPGLITLPLYNIWISNPLKGRPSCALTYQINDHKILIRWKRAYLGQGNDCPFSQVICLMFSYEDHLCGALAQWQDG